jgi:hypothetical protein
MKAAPFRSFPGLEAPVARAFDDRFLSGEISAIQSLITHHNETGERRIKPPFALSAQTPLCPRARRAGIPATDAFTE